MVFVASWISLRTISADRIELFKFAFISIICGGGTVLILVTQFVLQLEPWYMPRYMIPIAGMIFASSMNGISLAAERLMAEIDRNIVELLDKGMMRDRPFITIEAGTSGTGSDAANREVMDDRINEAILLVIKAAKNLVGPRGLNYAESAIQSKIDRQYSYNTIEPGSVIGDEQVPTDEDDPFFNQFQYVKICFNEVLETPEYDSIADEFVDAPQRLLVGALPV